MANIDAVYSYPVPNFFSVLTEDYLPSLIFGVYHLKQALPYSSEHVNDDGGYNIFVVENYHTILHGKIKPRHLLNHITFEFTMTELTQRTKWLPM